MSQVPTTSRATDPERARWEHFYHQADIGVRGIGPTESEAFVQAARALSAVVTDVARIRCQRRVEIHCEAPDHELLLADWLNALVYEMGVRQMLFAEFEVRLTDAELHGTACGETIDRERHAPAVEVKGATYTELRLHRLEDGAWVAQAVLDV